MHRPRSPFVPTCFVLMAALAFATCGVFAQEEQPPAGDGPPLPLHTVEGTGGLVLTNTALLVNPGPEGTVIGKPAFSIQLGAIGHKDLQIGALSTTLWQRIELSASAARLGLDDFENTIQAALGPAVSIGTSDIKLYSLNARVNMIREGDWDLKWMPAVTFGVHYKTNNDIAKINRKLGGALTAIGYDDNDGVDFTLTATKGVPVAGRPVLFSLGARATKSSQLGFQGFTDDYSIVLEGSAAMLVTDRIVLGFEYRQMPDDMGEIPGIVYKADDWWDIYAAYIFNDHSECYFVVGPVGDVLDERDEILFAAVFKYEF